MLKDSLLGLGKQRNYLVKWRNTNRRKCKSNLRGDKIVKEEKRKLNQKNILPFLSL